VSPFLLDEDIVTSNSFINWTVHLFILLTLSLFGREFSRLMVRKRRTDRVAPLVLLILRLLTFVFGAVQKTRCTAKEWMCWMNSKHGSMQQLQMFKGYVTVTTDGAFTVKCFAPNNFSISMKKNYFKWWIKYCRQIPLMSFCSSATGSRNFFFGRPCIITRRCSPTRPRRIPFNCDFLVGYHKRMVQKQVY
jgi:hypothetical protein